MWGIRQVFLEKLAFEMCLEDGIDFKHGELQLGKCVSSDIGVWRGEVHCCSDPSAEYIEGCHRLDRPRSNSVARLCVDMRMRFSSRKR